MAFSGKYELESQENYDEFLEAIGFANAKTDIKVITEVLQEGDDFTWSQVIPNWTWTNKFTIGKECELETMRRSKFTTTVTMEGGKIAIPFPQYHFIAEISGEKLIMEWTGSKKWPWTLIQTGPPELSPVYSTTAALLMHARTHTDRP